MNPKFPLVLALALCAAQGARAQQIFKPELDCYRTSVRFAYKGFWPVFERDQKHLFLEANAGGARGLYGVTDEDANFFRYPEIFFQSDCQAPYCTKFGIYDMPQYVLAAQFPSESGAIRMTFGKEGDKFFEMNWRPLDKDDNPFHWLLVIGGNADRSQTAAALRKDLLPNIRAYKLRDEEGEAASERRQRGPDDPDLKERIDMVKRSVRAQNLRVFDNLQVCEGIDDADIKKAVADKRRELFPNGRPPSPALPQRVPTGIEPGKVFQQN